MTTRKSLIARKLRKQTLFFLYGSLVSHCFHRASRARAYKGYNPGRSPSAKAPGSPRRGRALTGGGRSFSLTADLMLR